ncbi:MAG: cation-translocating P-type ATPase [Phycisphaerae bacterium]|nr:cation-translocating P-type ATPase [Phycisphaerae bacterium]
MGIAFALYGGFFDGMEARIRLFLQWVAMALGAASVFGPGRLFLSNAIASLRSRVPHMDLPITLALLAAIVGGFVSTLRGGGGVYAESVTMLVMLLLAGRFVQFRSQSRARHEVELLATLVPGVARRVRRGDGARPARGAAELDAPAWDEVPVESLVAGDLVLVPTGDAACADGVLRGAPNSIDMQALTGESRPVELRDGERVWAGCRPLRSPMLIEVTAAGAATRAGQLMALVDAALARRARVVEFANRIAGWFLLAVVALAALTVALWWSEGPAVAIEHAVALLVVTCPCALGLATPLTMVASIAKAARAGILIKGGDLIERLAVPGTIVLDKTGTLTEGRMRMVEIDGDESALAWAAALERSSTHPIARAIVRAQAERSATRSAERGPRASAIDRLEPEHAEVAGAAVESIQEHLGLGVRGDVDGVAVAVGRLEFVAREAAPSWERRARGLAERGLTPAAVSIDGRVRALLGVGDPIRADAAPTVRELRRRGWRVILASGDDAAIVRSCAEAIGVPPHDAFGECSPERKAELVRRCDWPRPLLMVGDGVNDVVAMASADAGISLGSGTRASLEVGDVCLARDGIGALPPLLRGAARSMRVVHANFSIGLVYNLVGAALAIGGWMNPLIAAILMPLSGLMVTAIAVRGPRFSNDARAPASSGGPDPHPSLAPEAVP